MRGIPIRANRPLPIRPLPIRPLPIRPLPIRPLPIRPLPIRPLPIRLPPIRAVPIGAVPIRANSTVALATTQTVIQPRPRLPVMIVVVRTLAPGTHRIHRAGTPIPTRQVPTGTARIRITRPTHTGTGRGRSPGRSLTSTADRRLVCGLGRGVSRTRGPRRVRRPVSRTQGHRPVSPTMGHRRDRRPIHTRPGRTASSGAGTPRQSPGHLHPVRCRGHCHMCPRPPGRPCQAIPPGGRPPALGSLAAASRSLLVR